MATPRTRTALQGAVTTCQPQSQVQGHYSGWGSMNITSNSCVDTASSCKVFPQTPFIPEDPGGQGWPTSYPSRATLDLSGPTRPPRLSPAQTHGTGTLEPVPRGPPPRRGPGGAWVLTGAVEVHHEAVLHVLLDELQCALKYLTRSRLLHGVRVPRVTEQGQQVVRGAWPASSGGREGQGTITRTKVTPSKNMTTV